MSGAALIGWIAGVHILGLGCVAFLMWPALRDPQVGPERRSDGEDEGWGRGPGGPSGSPERPRGGIPLPDAVPAGVRLREHGRLGDRLPRRERRPVREPGPARRPAHAPHRSSARIRSGSGRIRR